MNPLLGETLAGRYRVDAPLGRGGMAEVYKVWDEERAVHLAMKVLREDLAQDRIFLRRFQREAQTLEKLQHPNIVRFYGLERDGLLAFMLMDYVEGTTLRADIFQADGKPFSLDETMAVLKPVSSALHYAHGQGRVHCDVKPGNIMRKRNGDVLLADFGIARMTDGTTATMVGAGTPAYMAPEQVRGEAPSPQTDIYALGVVLYEMLTGGERPFTGEQATISGTTGEKVRWEQTHLNPPDARRFNRDLSAGAAALLQACLSKDPADRPASVLNLQNRLVSAEAVPEAVIEERLEDLRTLLEPEPPQAEILPQAPLAELEDGIPTTLEPEEPREALPSAAVTPDLSDPVEEQEKLQQLQHSVARLYQDRSPAIRPSAPGHKLEFRRLLESLKSMSASGSDSMSQPTTTRWLLSLLVAFLAAALLTYIRLTRQYYSGDVFLRNLILSPWTGLLLGVSQAFAMRMDLRRGALWSAGTGLAFLTGAVTDNPVLSWLIAGTVISLTQTFVTRRPMKQVWPWIPASMLAFALPELLMCQTEFSLDYSTSWVFLCQIHRFGHEETIASFFRLALSIYLTGVIYGLVSLPVVKYLLPRAPERTEMGPLASLSGGKISMKATLAAGFVYLAAAFKQDALRWLGFSTIPFVLLFATLIFPISYGRMIQGLMSRIHLLRWTLICLGLTLGAARAYLLRLKLWKGAVLSGTFIVALANTHLVVSPTFFLLIGAGVGFVEAFLLDHTFKTSWRRILETALLIVMIMLNAMFLAIGGYETWHMLDQGVFIPVFKRMWLVLPAALQMSLLYAFTDLPSALSIMKGTRHEED
ncbi:MAG: serine/threonine protein kinase [Anaerolineales bacterium]|nr:serine/threonine protein kinase [Anaerolineales bacterium]